MASSTESVSGVRSDERRRSDALVQLWDASKSGDLAALQRALIEGADVNYAASGDKNWTPLHWACYYGHLEIIRALLDAGADPEAKADDEATPLHWACLQDQVEAARILLLEAGANTVAKTDKGYTALHFACYRGHLDVGKALLDASADIDAVTNRWYNAPLACLPLGKT